MNDIRLSELFYKLVAFHRTPSRPEHRRAQNTIQAYENKIYVCFEFLRETNNIKIRAKQFNKAMAELYFTWLLAKYKHNYAVRCVEFVARATEFGAKEGYLQRDPLEYYTLKRVEGDRPTYYTPDQISLWENFKSEDQDEFDTANLAVLQIHTGFDFGDFAEIKRDHKLIFKGRKFLTKPRQKNGHEAIIPLSDKAHSILEYYDYKLPTISNPKYNLILKSIQVKLGIDIYICCKSLRKVFLMDQLNNKGVPIAAVSKMAGHKKIATTEKHYAQVNINLISNELDKLGL